MASSGTVQLPSVVLILRLLTLGLLAVSIALIAALKLNVHGLRREFTFRDFYAYRYVLAVAVIGCAYTLLQLPLAAVSIARSGKRSIVGGVAVALVLVLADVVFALLLFTAAAAGFGTNELKRYLYWELDHFVRIRTPALDKLYLDIDRFFELVYASAGLMLVAAACMTLVIMLSVYSLAKLWLDEKLKLASSVGS